MTCKAPTKRPCPGAVNRARPLCHSCTARRGGPRSARRGSDGPLCGPATGPRRPLLGGAGGRPRSSTCGGRGAALGVDLGSRSLLGFARPDRGDPLGDAAPPASPRPGTVVEVRHRHARQPLPHRPLDSPKFALFFRSHQGERLTHGLRPGRPAHAVDVVVGHLRHVEVHHVAQCLYIDAARGDVGGHEHAELARLEPGERRRALRLRPIAVNPLRHDAARPAAPWRSRSARCFVRVKTRASFRSPRSRSATSRFRLSCCGTGYTACVIPGAGAARRCKLDPHRRLQHLTRQRHDRLRHRRAEEECLAPRGQPAG